MKTERIAVIRKNVDYYEAVVGDDLDTRIFWYRDNGRFGIKWKIDGHHYMQWLKWSCRGGRSKYYRALRALYRAVKRDAVIGDAKLRHLAG